jgi:hypothetical protein
MEITMTNGEFLAKLNKRFNEILPSTAKKRTINELIFVLRNDGVEDYNLNINSKSKGFSFGLLKESFFPTRMLALKITSIIYEEDEESPYPILTVKTN